MGKLKAALGTTAVVVIFLLAPVYGAIKENLFDEFWGGVWISVQTYFQAMIAGFSNFQF